MLRNLSRTILMAAAAWFAAASALPAQQPGTDPLRGDVDGDGAVTAADARIVADYLVGKPVPAGANVRDRGDVNGDGRVTSVDAAIIRGFVAGRANVGRFKVGAPVSDAGNALARVRCKVVVRTATMTCGAPADQPGGPRGAITLTYGGQGQFVTLASTPGVATPIAGDSVEVTTDVTVKNLLPQRIGTTDGSTNDSVRVFFSMVPTTVVGSGTVTVEGGAGTGTFTASNQRYYSYAGPIDTQAVSPPRQWRFKMPNSVIDFDFELLIDAQVQYSGWVDLYPPYHSPSPYIVPVDTLMPGETLQLVDSVRSAKGFHLPGVPVNNWSSSNSAAATVSSSGFVTAVDVGTSTVTATAAGDRTGQVSIVVARPDTATSTISATPGTVTVGDSATVTVQLKYTSGGNVPRSGGTVALAVTGNATLTAVTDNNDGTYTAKVTSDSAEAVTISGTLDGHKIVSTATVTFAAGTPTGMAANSTTPQSATVGTEVASPPSVKITDTHGNGVAGVEVTFTVTAGAGEVSNGTAGSSAAVTTDGEGVATLTSWKLGTTAGTNTVTASVPVALGLADVVFTASGTVDVASKMTAASVTTQSAEVNTAVSAPPSVTVTDQYDNPVSGFTVTFTAAASSGQVSNGTDPAGASAAVVTNASGVATLTSWTVGTVVGTDNNTVTASGTGVPDVGFTASGTPGAVHHFVVEAAAGGDIGPQLAGAAFNVKVTAQDTFNNTVTGFTGTVDFTTTPPGGITAGGTSAAFTAGVLSSHAVTIGTAGDYTLTATRTGGTEAGTSNEFQVQQAPTAVADAPTPTSAPGDPWHGAFNTTFNVAAASGLMANDTRGLPLATVTHFGGGDLGGTVESNSASGTPIDLPQGGGGKLTVNTDGSVTFIPPTGFTGLYTFQYRIANVRGTSDAQVTIAVGVRPAVTDDSYDTALLGNVPINTATSTGFNVTTNDAGDAKVLALVSATGGTATLAPGGTFSFLPNAGHTGAASFTYTVTNGFGTTAAATVSMTVTGIAWFVDADIPSNGDGRLATPFKDLSSAFAAAVKPVANQPVFLYSSATSYTGGVTLLAGQRLVGEGATGASFAEVMNVSWPADAGTQPSIGGARPTVLSGLTLGNGNTLQGFNMGGAGTLTGNSFGTLTVSEVGINTTGQALNLSTGTLAGAGFTQLQSTGGTNNVLLTNVGTSGTPALGTNADALSGATGTAFLISGGDGSFTYAGTIANTTNLAVSVASKTGGTVTFAGDINPVTAARGISVANNTGGTTVNFSGTNQKISSGSATGVSLTNNGSSGGATVNFTGGNLVISTTSASGFVATGGGTVVVDGATDNSTINMSAGSGGSVALNVQNTTIGGGGLNFKRIDATGGTSGIVLNATGAGALTVPGDGASDAANTTRGRTTARSGGGTVALGSGGTISGTSGDGVSLTSTGAVTLRNLVITNSGGDGVQATTVNGLTIDNARITGHTNNSGLFFTTVTAPVIMHSEIENNAFGAAAPGSDIHNVRLISNTGAGSVANSVIANTSAGAERQLQIFSTTGTLNIGVTNSRIGGSTAGDGVGVYAFGSSNITANFQGDSIHNNSAFGIDSGTETTQSSSLNITVNNTAFRNNFLGITVAHGSSGTNTFNITNNNIQTNVSGSSHGININRLLGGAFTSFGLFSGTVSGNTIGTAGVAQSGSDAGDGIAVKTNGNGGTTRVSILNNTIRRYGQHGISILPRDASSGHTLHARIQNNNIAEGEAVISQDGINVTMGALNTDIIALCLDIGGAGGVNGNTVVGAVRNGVRVRSSGLPAANVSLTAPGYDGTAATYFANRNPAAAGASGNASFSNASGTTSAGNCTTP